MEIYRSSYLSLPHAFYEESLPTKVRHPEIYYWNESYLEEMGHPSVDPKKYYLYLSGNQIFPESVPLALAYAGHQFGHFNILGDGRAHLLGEIENQTGHRYDLQLKGSGPTKFSRRGDGRASLGPMLRELIMSEAMHALSIPTTRSLAIVTTGEIVERDSEYSGAILTRIARSHLRIGTFEYAAAKGGKDLLDPLMKYAMFRHAPHLEYNPDGIWCFLQEVIVKQASLVAQWMSVGFVHGVLNTDNISIAGETIDYGPCAFIDQFQFSACYSSIDRNGRYSYQNQPQIMKWNLARWIESCAELFGWSREDLLKNGQKLLEDFDTIYHKQWLKCMSAKFGIADPSEEDADLFNRFLRILEEEKRDFTQAFVELTQIHKSDTEPPPVWLAQKDWFEEWRVRLEKSSSGRNVSQSLMLSANPRVIPRHHFIEKVINEAEQSKEELHQLILSVKTPFEALKKYELPPQDGGIHKTTFCGT